MHFSFVTFGLCCLLVFCSHGFVIKSDENSIDFSAAKKPTIHFSVETETNEEIEELEFISGKYKENIPIQQSQEYEYVLPESFQITSGRAFSFEIAAIISEKKCISSTDSYRMNLICEDEERIKTISAKIGLNAQQSEMLSSPNTCFDEQNELWDSCTTDFTQYVSMKCNHLQACFPFEEALSFKTSCDALLNPFASVSYSCSRSHSFKKTVCFQLDLTKSNNYFASLVPDTELYPLLKGNLVVFFTTTIPQQCATDRYPIEVSSKHQTDNPVTKTTMLESDSTIYQVDFGRATFEAYTITISFDGRQLFERTIQVSSATVITPPPTPFETSVSVSSSVTFNWKKLDPQFTSTISFDCDDFTGTAYYHYGEPMNREAAKNYCNSLDDSLLPTMRSICRQNSFFSTEHYWIGLTDVERKDTGYNIYANTYQWDDGSTVFKMLSSYDNYVWASGEPNGLNEHCYELTYGKFNDINCDTTDLPVKPFCEKRNFDCTTIEPKYTILIYDENERFLSKYQYNGIDIRTKGIDKKFTHQINGLEKNKKYLYSIRSENCGAFKQTELKPFNYCFEEAPGQIEITSYQASFLPEIRSFSFSFLLPFLGVDCSDSESETTISVTTTDDRFDCSANPKLINNSSQKSSVITCALKTNLQHSTSLFLDVSLSNGPASQSITTIKVHLCPLIAEDCPSDCLGFCQECPSIGEPSECAFPCSWCQSLNTCLSSDAFCDPCDSFGPNDCPSGCNGKCFECSKISDPSDCVSLCSWCQSSNTCLASDAFCKPCDSFNPNDCPSGCHGNCGACSLIGDPSDCVSPCSWCQSSSTCLSSDAFCKPCDSFNPNDCPSGCHGNCGECSLIGEPSDCVSLCSWCQSSSICLASNEECPSESKDSSSSTTIILLCVLIPVFVLTIFIIILALYLRKRRLQPNPIKMDDLKTSE